MNIWTLFMDVLLIGYVSVMFLYLVVRIVSAAYFRSKLNSERNHDGTQKQQRRTNK